MFADDVAASGAEDVADKENIHLKSLHGENWRMVWTPQYAVLRRRWVW